LGAGGFVEINQDFFLRFGEFFLGGGEFFFGGRGVFMERFDWGFGGFRNF
jgi:hypothetical protein